MTDQLNAIFTSLDESLAPRTDVADVIDALNDILRGSTASVPRLDLGKSRSRFTELADRLVGLIARLGDRESDLALASAAVEEAAVERKSAEEALCESEQKFARAFQGNPVSMSIADENGYYLEVNRAWEVHTGYTADEALGHNMAELDWWEDSGELDRAMSVFMQNGRIDALEVRFQTKSGEHRVGVVTAQPLYVGGEACVLSTMEDITKRKQAEAERSASIKQLEVLTQQTITTMARLVEARDPYTAGHARRVTQLSAAIGRELGFDEQTEAGLRVAAQLHDIGKMIVPAEIFAKPGKLGLEEFALVKGHAQAGANTLSTIDFPWPVAQIVLQHHERLDGSGYPQGLTGGDILAEARVLAVADVVEAMSAHRPYRPSLGLEAALAEIERGRAVLYDAEAVDACLRLFREQGFCFA